MQRGDRTRSVGPLAPPQPPDVLLITTRVIGALVDMSGMQGCGVSIPPALTAEVSNRLVETRHCVMDMASVHRRRRGCFGSAVVRES